MEKPPAAPLVSSMLRTLNVEEIFEDFSSRRLGLIRALTTDQEEFYGLCDPGKEYLCLYGHANGSWEVRPPELMPPELPEPAQGINHRRDGMNRVDWLSFVAVRSDSWLISVAFLFGAFLSANERRRLFTMINNLPTVSESLVGRDLVAAVDLASAQNASDVVSKEPSKSGRKQRRVGNTRKYRRFFTPGGRKPQSPPST